MTMPMPGLTRSFGYPDYLGRLMSRGHLFVVDMASGWTASHTGSGETTPDAILRTVNSGATGSSIGLVYAYLGYGLSHGITSRYFINWDKDLRLFFSIARLNGGANTIARVQLKQATTEGVLAAKGIGIQITNLTLVGESYGSALATTGSQLLVTDRTYLIEIRHTAGVKIEWFVDGVLLGTRSTAANIPSGSGGVDVCVISILNGATAATAELNVATMLGWQEL